LLEGSRVSRVELDSALEIFGRFSPPALPSIDIAGQLKRQRVVRQTFLRQVKLLPGAVVIEITPVEMLGDSEMRFARIWAQANQRLDRRVGHGQPRRSVIDTQEVEQIVNVGKLVICKCEGGIAFDRFIQQANGLGQALRLRGTKKSTRDECFGPYVQIVSSKISRWFFLDGRFLFGGKLAFELRDDLFS
jgi:hypothetical protein